MGFLTCAYSDIGTTKQTNQDAYSLQKAKTKYGEVLFAIVCDGMGGLQKGELASAHLIRAFRNWFVQDFPAVLQTQSFEEIKYQWNYIIQNENRNIADYGNAHQLKLGTTVTASLYIGQKVYIIHVGDSRLYEIYDNNLYIHTEDQTVVARDVRAGRLTPEQALTDPRRSVLLQCVGASAVVEPQYIEIGLHQNATYFLCSDGFYHQLSNQELFQSLNPAVLTDEMAIQQHARSLVECDKQRGETDNITVLLIRH